MNLTQLTQERDKMIAAKEEMARTIDAMDVVINFLKAKNPVPVQTVKSSGRSGGFWSEYLPEAIQAVGSSAKAIKEYMDGKFGRHFTYEAVHCALSRYRQAKKRSSKALTSKLTEPKKGRRMSPEGEAKRMAGYQAYLKRRGFKSKAVGAAA